MQAYDTTKELKKKACKTNGEYITQAIGIQVTLTLEIKLQKYIF